MGDTEPDWLASQSHQQSTQPPPDLDSLMEDIDNNAEYQNLMFPSGDGINGMEGTEGPGHGNGNGGANPNDQGDPDFQFNFENDEDDQQQQQEQQQEQQPPSDSAPPPASAPAPVAAGFPNSTAAAPAQPKRPLLQREDLTQSAKKPRIETPPPPGSRPQSSSNLPPPLSKPSQGGKGGGSGPSSPVDTSGNMTVEDLQDVTQYAGVNIQEESDRILSSGQRGPDRPTIYPPEDVDKVFKVNTENLVYTVARIAENNRIAHVREEVYEALAHAAQERVRNILQDLVMVSKHRQDALTAKTRVEILSNTKRQLLLLEKADQEDLMRMDEDEMKQLENMEVARKLDKAYREKLQKKREAEDQKFKTQNANLVAAASLGLTEKSWMKSIGDQSMEQLPNAAKAGPQKKQGSTRKITIRDLIHYLEAEQQTTKSPFLFKAYLRQK